MNAVPVQRHRDHQAVMLAGALIGVVQVCQKIPTGNLQIVV